MDGESQAEWVSPCATGGCFLADFLTSREGEGYGDFFATMIRMKDEKVHDYDMGAWAAHRAGGIRPHPYSTNMTINPDTYKTLDKPGYFGGKCDA